jgi:ATP-dependent protease ClpP protease subunit
MSAATLIFLQGDEFAINEHSAFLFHNYSGGMIGKGGEMYSNMIHDRKWSEKLFRSQYEDFLTAEEISNLVDDKDIWMDANTVVARLEARNKAREEEAKLKENPPKKKTTKKKTAKKTS